MDKKNITIYLAFPDGVLDYKCRECTLICCHRSDQFTGNMEREIKGLVQLYPALENTAFFRRGDVVKFATPSGRCYFLDNDNRCYVEKEHGKAAKPEACRIFPFNPFARFGNVLVIIPNALCLLRVAVPARLGEVEGTHSLIESSLRQGSYLDEPYFNSLPQLRLAPSLSPTEALKQESAFRDLCSQHLGQRRFADMLRSQSQNPEELDSFVAWAGEVLNFDPASWSADRDGIDDLFFTMAPSIRISTLHLSREAKLRVLALSLLLIRKLQSLPFAKTDTLTDLLSFKGADEMISRLIPALRLLANDCEPIDLPAQVFSHLPPFGDPQMMFAAFGLLRAISQPIDVRTAIAKALQPLSISDRMALLVEIGNQIDAVGGRKTRKKK